MGKFEEYLWRSSSKFVTWESARKYLNMLDKYEKESSTKRIILSKMMYGKWHWDLKVWAMWSYDKTDECVQTKKIDQSDETSSSSRLLLVQ